MGAVSAGSDVNHVCEQLERLKRIVEAAGIGTWTWDVLINEVIWNDKARELLGLPPDTIPSYEAFLSGVHPDDRQKVRDAIAEVVAGAGTYYIEYRALWPDGTIRWLWSRGHASYNQTGGLVGMAGVVLDVTDVKRYQDEREALLAERERQQEFLRRLFDNAPIGIAVINRAGIYILANPRYESIPGIPGLSVVGHPVGTYAPPETAAFMRRILAHVLQTGQSFSVREYEAAVGPDRPHTWWNNDVVPLMDREGRVESVLALTQEVTQQVLARKRIEELASQMQASRDQLEVIINTLSEGVVVVDPAGRILSANPAALAMHGVSEREPVSWNIEDYPGVFDVRYPDGRPVAREDWPLAKALLGQPVQHLELHGRRLDTGDTWVGSYSAVPVNGPDGQLQFVVIAIHDLTPMKQAEQALRRSEERLRLATEAAQVGTWDWDIPSDQLIWSEQFKVILGMSLDTVPSYSRFLQCLHPDDRPRVEQDMPRRLGERGEADDEYRVVCPDGTVRWVYSRGRAFQNEQGQPYRHIGVVMDITARKEAQAQLQAANEALEQRVLARTAELEWRTSQLRALVSELTQVEANERWRLAQVLHDHLQQLLVASKLGVGALRRKTQDPALLAGLSGVDDLLTESIKASRTLTVELSPPILYREGLPAVLRWLAQWMHEKHNLAVELDLDERADPQAQELRLLLFESVRELLFNTAKHAHVREARVRCRRISEEQVEITVSDAGVGFDYRRRLAGKQTKSGFGLFSIGERLELMGGHLYVHSMPGKGTVAVLLAPMGPVSKAPQVTAVAAPLLGQPAAPPRPATKGNIRVMLADDHDIVRAGLQSLLATQPDIEVVAQAKDGLIAVELARTMRPDVVVMDVAMPGMDGIEATRQIRAEMSDVQVIGLSMHEEADTASRMCSVGACMYLTKDSQLDGLVAAIRKCVVRDGAK